MTRATANGERGEGGPEPKWSQWKELLNSADLGQIPNYRVVCKECCPLSSSEGGCNSSRAFRAEWLADVPVLQVGCPGNTECLVMQQIRRQVLSACVWVALSKQQCSKCFFWGLLTAKRRGAAHKKQCPSDLCPSCFCRPYQKVRTAHTAQMLPGFILSSAEVLTLLHLYPWSGSFEGSALGNEAWETHLGHS